MLELGELLFELGDEAPGVLAVGLTVELVLAQSHQMRVFCRQLFFETLDSGFERFSRGVLFFGRLLAQS